MRFDLRVGGRALDVALPLVGAHNLTNFLAAAAAAHAAGLAPEAIAAAASQVAPAPHRGEVRLLAAGVTLLDDCYNSNPAAVAAAVSALGLAAARRRVAVLGDMLELGPRGPELHRQAGRALAGRVELVVGVGALARDILAGAREAGLPEGALLAFPDAATAAAALPGLVQPGDAVLVKGSRGVRLEAVVEALVAGLGAGAR
jgi:UDP-N-acetylmuramoyl-tripeptide--D-alanyl-D-alanine ligase